MTYIKEESRLLDNRRTTSLTMLRSLQGVEEAVGTHASRKTFGYHAYQRGVDLALLQKMFNHSSESIILDYIGITQDQMDEVYISMNL